MFPTFWTLTITVPTARVIALVVGVALSAFIIWDGLRAPGGRARLPILVIQAVGFLGVSVWAILAFVNTDHLPEHFAIPLRTWGLMVVLGMSACYLIQRHFGREVGLTADQILTIWVYGGFSALLGARGLHVLVNLSSFRESPLSALMFWDGGLAYIGGVLGALTFAILALRRWKQGPAALDALILGIALTHGFGRIGCFFAGCCYGRETDSFLGVSFPVGSIAQYTLAQAGRIDAAAATPFLHPTQLYEAAASFAIGGLLLAWFRLRRPAPGAVLFGYLVAYPIVRFAIELVRDDPEREFLFRFPEESPYLLSTTQSISLALMPVALLGLWWIHVRKKPFPLLAASAAPVVPPEALESDASATRPPGSR